MARRMTDPTMVHAEFVERLGLLAPVGEASRGAGRPSALPAFDGRALSRPGMVAALQASRSSVSVRFSEGRDTIDCVAGKERRREDVALSPAVLSTRAERLSATRAAAGREFENSNARFAEIAGATRDPRVALAYLPRSIGTVIGAVPADRPSDCHPAPAVPLRPTAPTSGAASGEPS